MKMNGQDKNETPKAGAPSGVRENDRAGQKTTAGSRSESDAGVVAQVQESGREIASRSLHAIGSKTKETTTGYQADISSGLHTLADGLRQTSTTVQKAGDDMPLSTAGARYIDDLATKIESVSGYFERADATALIKDVKGFAKRNPTVFVGGAFALGFALSRLVRSAAAAPNQR